MRWLEDFTRGLGAPGMAIMLLFGAAAPARADANKPDGSVVALTYDSGTETLFKAYVHALYRSVDDGKNWQKMEIPALESGRISSVAASPASKGVMYVAGPGLGVLRTDDGGKTWTERNEGLPTKDIIAVAAHTTQPETVYAVVRDRGFYRSQDVGKNWRLMEHGSQEGLRQLIHSNMAGSMQTGWLFAATAKGVRRVMDCFCLWQDAGKLGTQAYGVTYDPREPKHIYTTTGKGLFRSSDGGENWVKMTSPGPKVVALVFTRSGTLFVIGADGALYQSADEGSTWKQVNA